MANTDPVLKRLKRARILMAVGFTLMLLAFGLDFIVIRSTHGKTILPTNFFSIEFSVMVVAVILAFASSFLVIRHYNKSQQQRNIAVQGGTPGRIAAEQPVASTASLTLPFTLRFRANWLFLFTLIILPMLLIFVIGFVVFYLLFAHNAIFLSGRRVIPFSVILISFGVLLLLYLLVASIALLFAGRRLRQYIEVSEGGIKGRFLGQENDLHWDEIKLFALWGGKSKAMHAYEAAGERGMVRWTVPVKNRWYCSIVSTLPFGEYYPQMQDVLALIAKKTDLPLRDLRLKWYGGEQK